MTIPRLDCVASLREGSLSIPITDCDCWRGCGRARTRFGTPRTMTVRLVAGVQDRLFWRVGTGRASECCVPLRDGAGHVGMGSDVSAEQCLRALSSALQRPAWSWARRLSPSQQGRNTDLGTYRAGSGASSRSDGPSPRPPLVYLAKSEGALRLSPPRLGPRDHHRGFRPASWRASPPARLGCCVGCRCREKLGAPVCL